MSLVDPQFVNLDTEHAVRNYVSPYMTTPDLELIYVGDPMCSWCWGFAPVVESLDGRFDFPLSVVAGGLRPGPSAEVLDDRLRQFLLHHWYEVEERSGQPFNPAGLDRSDWRYDTLVPDTAVVTMRTISPADTMPFFARLQRAFYAEAIDITDPAVYPTLLGEFDVDPDEFVAALASEELLKATWADFSLAQRLGATGFPSLYLREDETVYAVTQGYQPFEPLEAGIRGFLEERHPAAVSGLVCEIGEIC